MSPDPRLKMLTFGPMIDSELTRFVLDHYGIAYVEERQIFGWVSLLTLFRGGYGRIPLVTGGGLAFSGPRPIVDHYETTCEPACLLLPAEEPARTAVEADWDLFNGDMAAETARLAYFHLLPCRDPMIEAFSRGMSPGGARFVAPLYGTLQKVFTLLLQLSPAAADDALARILRIVDGVDARLRDGRPFVGGDRITLADLAFATGLAPLVLPDHYTAPIPGYANMPTALQRIVDGVKARPAAALVQKVYALRLSPRRM